MDKHHKFEVKKVGQDSEIIIIRNIDDAVALFNLDDYLIPYLQEEPFFTEVSRYIHKRPSLSIPTAAIAYNTRTDEFEMLWNPLFFATLPDVQVFGVIKHELLHFVCRHLTERRRDPAEAHNIASDGAINSLIVKDEVALRRAKNGELPLPGFAIVPGRRPDPIPPKVLARMTKAQIAYNEKVADLIEHWPALETTEFYFEKFMEFQENNPKPEAPECPIHGPNGKLAQKRKKQGQQAGGAGGGGSSDEKQEKQEGQCDGDSGEGEGEGENGHEHGPGCGRGHGHGGDDDDDMYDPDECTCGGYGSLDDHSGWDDLPDDLQEYVRSRAQNVVEKAVREAENRQNGWGSIPAHMRELIRKSVSNIVNWREVLKHFVGQVTRGNRTTSIKKINKKYPYIHPGVKKGYVAKILVAIDESGSVPNGCVELFFAELATLTKTMEIDIVSFDCECDPKEIVTWKKGQGMPIYRNRCGGTNFDAPTAVANDPRFRGRWDGFIILTDGFAPKPGPSRIPRGWGIAPGCTPEFQTDEVMFKIEKGSMIKKGSWY